MLMTTAIILKIEPGPKRSSVVYALSPSLGKLIFVYYEKSSFVVPGPFRVLNLELDIPADKLTMTKNSKRLAVLKDAEMIHHYDHLSDDYEQLTKACDLGMLALDLSLDNHESPKLFSSLLHGLEALGEGAEYLPWRVTLMVNFLNEFGSMPTGEDWSENQKNVFQRIYKTTEGRQYLPNLKVEKWLELERWIIEMIDWAGLRTDFL